MSESSSNAAPAGGKPVPDTSRRLVVAALCLFAGLLLLMWVPDHARTGWNVNTRLALVYAIVDEGTFSIDRYHADPRLETMDKALFDGHFYSDKIFGVSLPAVPVYWLAKKLAGDGADFITMNAAHTLKNWCAALPGAVAALLFWGLLVRTGANPRRALVLTGLAVLGSMWYGYSTVFYPYSLGLATALGALYVTFYPPAGRLTPLNCLAVGFLLGYTLLCDLVFALLVLGIGVLWLMRLLDQVGIYGVRAFAEMSGERSKFPQLVLYSATFWLGVVIPLSLFFGYCHSIFGSFSVPYEYEASDRFREGMQAGVMGATLPKLHVLYRITLHPFRGIFVWSPIVLAGIAGCVLGTRQYGKRRMLGWLGLYSFVAYLLFNGGYYMWWGGWGMGPRFLLPSLPFVLLGLGELTREGRLSAFERAPVWTAPLAWWSSVALGVAGVALSLPLALFDPQVPQGNQDGLLAEADWGTTIEVPQFTVLRAVYTGRVPLAGLSVERKSGVEAPGEFGQLDHTRIFLLLAAAAVLLAAGTAACPVKLPGIHRNDYPFHTVDGSAAPPPPIG